MKKNKWNPTNQMEKVIWEATRDHGTREEVKGHIEDVLTYGCQSGNVTEMIYYKDTLKFYNTHKKEINALLHATAWEIGTADPKLIFGEKWNEEDPLVMGKLNQNLLSWFAWEETLRKIYQDLFGEW